MDLIFNKPVFSAAKTSGCLSIMLCLVFAGLSHSADFAGGIGSRENPFRITTAAHLTSIGSDPNLLKKCFVLMNDIDLDPNLPGNKAFDQALIAPGAVWWDSSGGFAGCFDGNGRTVKNLRIENNAGDSIGLGLFGRTGPTSEIHDLSLENTRIDGKLCSCDMGGLVGYNQGLIRNCHSANTALVNGVSQVGGLVGRDYQGTIINCWATGPLTAVFSANAGGLVGRSEEGLIVACHADISFIANSYRAGGLIGHCQGSCIVNCYANGTMTMTGDSQSRFGGFVGYSDNSTYINCYSTGWAQLVGPFHPGNQPKTWRFGFVSYGDRLAYCYSRDPDWKPLGSSFCYSLCRLNDEQMMQQASFVGWDFLGVAADGPSDVWMMPEDGGQPILTASPEPRQGKGTTADPYLIASPQELGFIAHRPEASYRLICDIDFTETEWKNITFPVFSGRLNGAGHCLANLTIDKRMGNGLFGWIRKGAVVENLRLENVRQIAVEAWWDVGLLAGLNQGTVVNCSSTGLVLNAMGGATGGLIGRNEGCVIQCSAQVELSGHYSVGGLVGFNDGLVKDCYADIMRGNVHVGALVGTNGAGMVTNCYALGSVERTSSDSRSVGGLIGSHYAGDSLHMRNYYIPSDHHNLGNQAGIPLSDEQMRQKDSFVGWEFYEEGQSGGVWVMPPQGYPVLAWQTDLSGLVWLPHIKGQTLQQARTTLADAGLQIGSIEYDWDVAADVNTAIDINPSHPVAPGTSVKLLMSRGPYDWRTNAGEGSMQTPYDISSAGQLRSLGEHRDLWGKHFLLTSDIDLGFQHIYDHLVRESSGTLDGGGHTILGLSILGNGERTGLFGGLNENSEIRFLSLSNARIVGRTSLDLNRDGGTGALLGENLGTVMRCSSSGRVTGTNLTGGLVGSNLNALSQCSSTATVTGGRRTGGLAGRSATMSECFYCGSVVGAEITGGLMGSAQYTSDSYAIASIAGKKWVGGLMGMGQRRWGGELKNCYALAYTTDGEDYALGMPSGQGPSYADHCYGLQSGDPKLVFYDAIPLIEAQMKQQASFEEWDFETIWQICEGQGYPRLQWEDITCAAK